MRQPPILPSDVELSNTIRRRWMDLAVWLRSFIYSKMLNLNNQQAVRNRLNKISDEADLFYTQYYGPDIGFSVKSIYQNYFDHVQEMIESFKGNTVSTEQHLQSMYKTADDLAELLSKVNRYWDKETVRTLLYVLVDKTERQIEDIVKGRYDDEVASYDEYIDQTYRIADEFTYGMLKQFRIPR